MSQVQLTVDSELLGHVLTELKSRSHKYLHVMDDGSKSFGVRESAYNKLQRLNEFTDYVKAQRKAQRRRVRVAP